MKKKIQLLALTVLLLTNLSFAQEKATVDAKLDIFLTLPAQGYIAEKFDVGAGGSIGAAIFVPKAKTYITPYLGFDFMAARSVGNDDTYIESIFFTNVGVELTYQLLEKGNFKLLPLISISSRSVIDRYQVANGNLVTSNSGTSLEYDKLPELFSASALSLNLGIENRINDTWFITLSYELYQPEVTANLNNSYDNIDNEIFDPATQKLNLSTIKIGVGAYFW